MNHLLICLLTLRYQGQQLVAVVIRPRYGGESTARLAQTQGLVANFLFLTRGVSSIAALRQPKAGIAAGYSIRHEVGARSSI